MPEEKPDSSGFKVVDRRSFTSGGERVPDQPAQREDRSESIPPQRDFGSSSAEPQVSGSAGDATRFTTLISYLSTTAMFQLGLLPGPEGEAVSPDLASGRRMIDLLEVLQEKTRGNLTADESKLLEDVLYELRMSFVEVQKHQHRKGK